MITVETAKEIITNTIPRGEIALIPIEQGLQRVMAQDVKAPFDFPLFSASAMDGYAIRHNDTETVSKANPIILEITAKLFAGDRPNESILPGKAIQIMTGAAIPLGATAVIPQEEIEFVAPKAISISRQVRQGENIRFQGEEIKQGRIAICATDVITPAVIGYLTSLGIYQVTIFKEPRISILPSGSELIRDIDQLTPGKVFESNSYALAAAIKQIGITSAVHPPVVDQLEPLTEQISQLLNTNDITLISGGVSVGEKDYIRPILADLEVKPLFWQVAQKPGKPLFMGKRGNSFVFGLPGNPASSLVCFYEYVKPAILQWLGYRNCWPVSEPAHVLEPLAKKMGRTYFLRAHAKWENGKLWVKQLSSQESHRMGSFAHANCLAVFPNELQQIERGGLIDIHWIDGREHP